MDMFELDLGEFGAPGFSLVDRLDMTGHQSGRVDSHINTDINDSQGDALRYTGPNADLRDLTHNQLPGFNGMQNGW